MRRLRENAMLEAEISPSGDVIVEGHNVGHLEGFRFTADTQAEGSDAKAVRAAAQKALAAEFEKRAERFAAAPNGDFALGSDGVLRYIGAAIATLVASEDVMKPRAVLLADEQLTGLARDKVAARIERFVAHHIETVLKPLTDLAGADALTGMTRGLAFQLVENLGVLQRRDVIEEVRGLDQDSRAALRRLGVRFGAYHIFMPALLKPAPAGLITLLWSLQNDGREKNGYGEVVNMMAAGRTSAVVEPEFDPVFYRLAGYRVLGRRAVRIDILERLADLIRPALAWRPGTEPRPEGAYDGSKFLVTAAMMSILGATAEDMEEILKSLGYRHEASTDVEVTAKLAEMDDLVAKAAESAKPKVPDAEPVPAPVVEEAVAEAVATEAPESAEDAPVEVAAEEAKLVLLWRHGRFENRHRHAKRHEGRGRQNNQRHAAENVEGEKGERRHFRGAKRKSFEAHGGVQGNERQNHGAEGENRKHYRDEQRKFDASHKGGQKRGGQNNKHEGNQRFERQERVVKLDPDSPFAKLAALKEQLKK